MEPICEFKDTKQAAELLKAWQHNLALDDWTIKIKLVEPHEFINENVDGECEYEEICKSAIIRIMKPEYYGDRLLKYCAERILVHELLHCKLCLLETDNPAFDRLMHQTHEDITRALVCAKYRIIPEWFKNISYDEEGKPC